MAIVGGLAAFFMLIFTVFGASIKASSSPVGYIEHFVEVRDGRFVVGPQCTPFYISGWNAWEAMEAAAGVLELYGGSLPDNTTGPALIRDQLDRAKQHGLNVMRTWAHTVTAPYALMSGPGDYNEDIFRGLDYLLDQAGQRGVRLLLAIVDNWQPTGGADQFMTWAGGEQHEDFFKLEQAKQLYKDHVSVLLNRVNTVNGRVYKEDPTIFAWELINEPRCFECGTILKDWFSEMAAYVKSIDSRHLLTIGEEGFYPEDVPQAAANPDGMNSWAFWEGQSFQVDHADPNIDFAALHLWMHNWEDATEEFVQKWLRQHIVDAKTLGKPLLIEEFGAWGVQHYLAERDYWYKFIYDIIAEDATAFGPTQGALFWSWFAQGQRAPAEEGGGDGGLFGIFDTDSTWQAVAEFTASMKQLSSLPFGGSCPAVKAGVEGEGGAAAPVADCSATWLDGKQGTGFEGATCQTDINECARGTAICDPNAACVNKVGSYSCVCFNGFSGDGKTCTPTPVLAATQSAYFTRGVGYVACEEGTNVQYPSLAPGWAYDDSNSLDRHKDSPWKGGFGSRIPVEPVQCMLACNMAPGCDSFAYNSNQRRCFLKSGSTPQLCPKPETLCVSARGQAYACGAWQTYFNTTAMGLKVQASDGKYTGNLGDIWGPAAGSSWLGKAIMKHRETKESP